MTGNESGVAWGSTQTRKRCTGGSGGCRPVRDAKLVSVETEFERIISIHGTSGPTALVPNRGRGVADEGGTRPLRDFGRSCSRGSSVAAVLVSVNGSLGGALTYGIDHDQG